jgi:hypothetical protein
MSDTVELFAGRAIALLKAVRRQTVEQALPTGCPRSCHAAARTASDDVTRGVHLGRSPFVVQTTALPGHPRRPGGDMYLRDAYPELVRSSAEDRIRELERNRDAQARRRGRKLGRRIPLRRVATEGANR